MLAPSDGLDYLEHLTEDDLLLLARAARLDATDPLRAVTRLRNDPGLLERVLGHPDTIQAVLGERDEPDPLLGVSPFLLFTVAVHRALDELGRVRVVQEWAGPRQRLPVLGTDALIGFLADPARRFFLAELLTSYTHVASGSLWTHTRRGWRRQRFSELDLVRMAALFEVLPRQEHAGLYRRLGDLALFLAGVFPDHTATRRFAPIEVERLSRALDAVGREDLAELLAIRGGVGLLDQLGQRWYGLAVRSSTAPQTRATRLVADVAQRFPEARRVLNYLTDHHLFPFRARWFPNPQQ
ncbi:MAG: hypothetical protein M3O70_16945 [Actinomycetota bacterium]|nr:hypothetical protein [Actinomycetota bacterium]